MIHWIQPEDLSKARQRRQPFLERLSDSPMNAQLQPQWYESPLWMSLNLGVYRVANPIYEMATETGSLGDQVMQYPQLRGSVSVLSPLYRAVGMDPAQIKVVPAAPSYIMPTPAEQYTSRLTLFHLTERMLDAAPAFGFLRQAQEHARVKGVEAVVGRFASEHNDIGRLAGYLGEVVVPGTGAGTTAMWGHEAAHHLTAARAAFIPVAIERALRAAEVYQRLRKALRRGAWVDVQTGAETETHLTRWQQKFQQILETEELAE